MRSSSSSRVVAAVIIVAVLAADIFAAPCSHLAKRQADWSQIDSFMDPAAPDTGLSDVAGIADGSVASTAWPAADVTSTDANHSFMAGFDGAFGQDSLGDQLPADSSGFLPNDGLTGDMSPGSSLGTAPPSNDNLVGNSLAQIDDSVNISDTDIQYPGDSQLTDNAGTAVSGNNNDIAPIINAPVTVIINSDDDHNSKQLPQALPDSAIPAATQLAKAMALAQVSAFQKGRLASPASPLQVPGPASPQAAAMNQAPVDDVSARIEQLVSYAIVLSRSRF
ncbi:hypothetical protein EV183_002893 [Coemansia sp. RSA 2336]|nr:hypothetical protein EV183_002893 [Coemansia sp. RSA 2336]